MPSHTCREVVDAEQVGELLGVVHPPLHRVEQLELPGEQRLVTPRQVPEDVVDPAPDLCFVNRGRDRGPGGDVERPA